MAKKISLFKFFVLALCVLIVPVFAGCSLVTTNVDKYLAETVASYDSGRIVVNREELLISYNYIGNSRFDNQSTPTEEGVRDTIDLEIKRKLLVEFLTSDANDMVTARNKENVEKITLSTYQLNEVWQEVYDYINDSVEAIETELRAADGKTYTEAEEDEDDEDEYDSYDKASYDKTYTVVEKTTAGKTHFVLEKVKEDTPTASESIGLYTDAEAESKTFSQLAKQAYDTFRAEYWHWTDSKVMRPEITAEKSYSDEAWSKFINNLLRNENERNLTKTNEDAFLRNVQMIYKIYYQNAVLSAFQERYTEANISISAKDVADKYRELYSAQYDKYADNPSAFDSAVSTGAGDVYYMKDANKYMMVNHILIKFSDDQNDRIKAELVKLQNCEIDEATYKRNVANIKAETTGYNRETRKNVPLNEIYDQIMQVSTKSSSADKITAFGNLMHIYSQDDATIGAEACYYIPTDTSITDAMQASFADASRELYNDGKGKIGDMTTQWVETTYGYHIIMFTGLPTNVDGVNSNTDAVIVNLDGYRLNPLYNKTMLDKVIEKVSVQQYATYEEQLLDNLMGGKVIVYYPDSFKDIYS